MTPLVFPYLAARIPIKRLYPILMSFYPVYFLALPLLNIIARIYRVPGNGRGTLKARHGRLVDSISRPAHLRPHRQHGLCTQCDLPQACGSIKSSLGRTFGIAQMVASIARGIARTLARCDSFIPDYLVLKIDTPRLQLTLRTLDRLQLVWRVACVDSHDRLLRHGCIHGKERKGWRGREGTAESTA